MEWECSNTLEATILPVYGSRLYNAGHFTGRASQDGVESVEHDEVQMAEL